MVAITWLGEDDLYPDQNGPRYNTWNGTTFKAGESVDITDEHMIAKARTNRFYSVEGEEPAPRRGPGRPRKSEASAADPRQPKEPEEPPAPPAEPQPRESPQEPPPRDPQRPAARDRSAE